jgi:hypothetical protein
LEALAHGAGDLPAAECLPPAGGSRQTTTANAAFTYYLDRATFDSAVASGPAGCPHSGNNTAVLTSQPTKVGGNWSLSLTRAPASSLVILLQNVFTLSGEARAKGLVSRLRCRAPRPLLRGVGRPRQNHCRPRRRG